MFRHAEPPSFVPTITDAARLPPRSSSKASGKAPDLPSAGDLERAIQRRCLSLLVAATLFACAIFVVAFSYLVQRSLALTSVAYFVLALVCDGWAKRSGAAVWPLRALAFLLVGLIVWHMLQQGPTLPAAAWWLSAMPLVLAAAGQFEMAIATVVAILGIASWLQFAEPVSAFGSGPGQVAPWRHFLAVFGSQILALGVIVVSMRQRRAANELLEQARRVAEEAAQTKSRFLANMSHEIRNPLNVVVGTVPLLRSAEIDEAQRARLLDLQEISAKALIRSSKSAPAKARSATSIQACEVRRREGQTQRQRWRRRVASGLGRAERELRANENAAPAAVLRERPCDPEAGPQDAH